MDDMADMAAQSSKLTSSETAANEELALLRKDYAEASECAEDYALTRSDIRALKERVESIKFGIKSVATASW